MSEGGETEAFISCVGCVCILAVVGLIALTAGALKIALMVLA